MLSDILWEEIAAALNIRIASLITIIFQVLYSRISHKKNPPIKLITDGFNCLLLVI